MTRQLRLGDGVPGDAIWEACAELGVRLSNVVPHTAAHPAQSIFVTADRQTMVHFLEDEAAGRAVIFRGAREEEMAAAFASALGAGGARAGDAASPSAARGDSGAAPSGAGEGSAR